MKRRIGFSGLVTLAIQLASVSMLAALALLSVQWWSELPEPPRFEAAAGAEDSGATSCLAWFGLPALGAAVTVLFFSLQGLVGVMQRMPWLISLPRQKAFVALPAAERSEVVAFALGRLSLFPIPINAFMIYGQWAQFQAALGKLQRIDFMAVAGFLLAALIAVAWYLVSIATLIERFALSARTGSRE